MALQADVVSGHRKWRAQVQPCDIRYEHMAAWVALPCNCELSQLCAGSVVSQDAPCQRHPV